MQKSETTIGFIIFVFVKANRELFLSSILKIITVAYDNGLLLRYVFLMFFFAFYSFFPYLILLNSYFIIKFLYEQKIINLSNFLGLDAQVIYFIGYMCCILLFISIKKLVSDITNLTSVIISIYIVYLSLFILVNNVNSDFSIVEHLVVSFVFLLFEIILHILIVPLLDILIAHINLIMNFIWVMLSSPSNFLFIRKICHINFYNKKMETYFGTQKFIAIPIAIIFFIITIFYRFLFPEIGWFLNMQISSLTLLVAFFFVCVQKSIPIILLINLLFLFLINNFMTEIITFLFNFYLLVIFIFIPTTIYFSYKIVYFTVKIISIYRGQDDIVHGESIRNPIFSRKGFSKMFSINLIATIISIIPINFFKNRWLSRKHNYLLNQNIHMIFDAFNSEYLPEGREFILQFVLASSSPLEQKLEILRKMVLREEWKKHTSQVVLDQLAKTFQILKQEQRQKELRGDMLSIAQIKSFDFTDLTIDNNQHITLSPIDSARQQLLNWLKGETPENPSIDKLLIYQWQDYEISIGLKYSGRMGGDFYDLFQINENKFGLIVGDLTGHGVETALNLSKTHKFWAETDLSQDVLTTMRAFEQNFKTTFHPFPNREGCELCYLQLKDNEITLSRAGLHLGLIRDNQWHKIAPPPHENFMAIGKWRSLPVKRYTSVELKAGETLIVYTDGLYENANQNGEQFGQDNFQQLLLQQQSLDMNTLIDTVFRTVYEYCQPEPLEDDETLLVIRRISSTADLGD